MEANTEMTPRTHDALRNIQSVRHVKNGKGGQGKGGQWWKAAKENNQVHAGWRELSPEFIVHPDFATIKNLVGLDISDPAARKRDFNALRQLLDTPSRHLWITFEAGDLWWCTVKDRAVPNPNGATDKAGHFWLECDRPWSNYSLEDKRQLVMTELPGTVIAAAGFRATVCEPKGWKEILRIIRNEEDADARAARHARETYQDAVAKLITRLGDKDFEVLIDLILSRSGWARLAKLGGVTEGIDIEVENASADEIAFVQVKSSATQAILNDYVLRFNERRDHYKRMIFAVHSSGGDIIPPSDQPVQVWDGKQIARLVVKLGLGDWVATRL